MTIFRSQTILARGGRVYAGQLAAQDETIAAHQETIAALRRRAAAAEDERDDLRARLAAATVPRIAPTGGPGATEAPRRGDTTPAAHRGVPGLWRRLQGWARRGAREEWQ